MFEDSNKELKFLEEELLALDKKDEEFEAFYAEIFEEYGEKTPSEEDFLKDLLTEKPKRTAQAQRSQPAAHNAYADQKKTAPVKKDHSIRNLTIIIILELMGIAGVAAWWLIRLL